METGMKFGRNTPSIAQVKETTKQVLEAKLKQKPQPLTPAEKETVINGITDDLLGFGPLEQLLHDDTITEIMVNGPEGIYIEKKGKKTLSAVEFDDEAHLRTMLEKMLVQAGRRL